MAWLWPSAQNATARHRQTDAAADEQLVSLTHAQRDLQQNAPTDHATKPIEQIKVGERVLAHNPEVSDEERASWTEPDWSDWLQLSLVMPKEDGSELKIELLRSEDWVRSQINFIVDEQDDASTEIATPKVPTIDIGQANLSVPLSPLRPMFRDLAMTDLVIADAGLELVGLAAEMDLPELAITGPAVIVDLRSAPQIQPGAGRVVTATFHHSSGDVIDLTIGDKFSTETIGTTSNHPFWSEDRQEYVQAATLEIGEQVRTCAGDTKQVVSLLPTPGPQAVFNLEVHGEHVYFVGEGGVLVHNVYSPEDALNNRAMTRAQWKEYHRAQRHMRPSSSGMGNGGNKTVDRVAGEIEGAMQQAGRMLDAGIDKGTSWGERYLDAKAAPLFERLPLDVLEGNARQQIADRILKRNFYFKEANVIPNHGHQLGLRNKHGNLCRPDYQIPLNRAQTRWGILDMTTERAGGKIWNYYDSDFGTPLLYNITWR
ncbi:MAG: hypothetical protein KDB00_11030 [Planctomycetales bacterium]|nr:hypothetical protein [Planctomycetales bacterium]